MTSFRRFAARQKLEDTLYDKNYMPKKAESAEEYGDWLRSLGPDDDTPQREIEVADWYDQFKAAYTSIVQGMSNGMTPQNEINRSLSMLSQDELDFVQRALDNNADPYEVAMELLGY